MVAVAAGLGEVAEAMYQAARTLTPAKTPEALDETNVGTQRRYLLLARAAMATIDTGEITVPDAVLERQALDLLADELAWKLNNPRGFSERVRTAFERYAEIVGPGGLTDEVKEAMKI